MPPPIVLTSWSQHGEAGEIRRPLHGAETIFLDYHEYFSIEFVALDFTAPEKNRFRYTLKSSDEDWIDIGGSGTLCRRHGVMAAPASDW